MSSENWDISKYRDDHECEEHWELRKSFMERWQNNYPEDRLVCLARVFANIEFLGCRYPNEVMKEVALLSQEVAKDYRKVKKTKLQRTFVSASDAAEDRARGIKREGGVVINEPNAKSAKITFVPQGQSSSARDTIETNDTDDKNENSNDSQDINENDCIASQKKNECDYLNDLMKIKCVDPRRFNNEMFNTCFGRLILLIRPWSGKLSNIMSNSEQVFSAQGCFFGDHIFTYHYVGLCHQTQVHSKCCQVCRVPITSTYENQCFSLMINDKLVARASGPTKNEAKNIVEIMAWNRLREEVICVLVKELWIAQGERISMNDVTGKKEEFGTRIENSVATKMMKLMGWKGGGLGVEAQGIAEPIKPHLQMVNRAGLGSNTSDIRQLRRAGQDLMRRYIASDSLDVDLVFSGEFTKEERAILHSCAQRAGLASKSYGDVDRFLVVKKKLDPFSLVHAVLEKGGNTPKYQVFIPAVLLDGR